MNKSNGLEAVAGTGPNGGRARASVASQGRESSRQDLADFRLPTVLVGRVVAIRNSNEPLVDFPSNTSGELVPARSLIPVTDFKTGHEVALVFEDGDPARPIIVGLIQVAQSSPEVHGEVKLDQETLVLSAKKQVVLQCGKASITLTSAGKVLVRGAYLLSRSSGVNRIKGGSVQIN
jgi:uncharacterized protein DUF6484